MEERDFLTATARHARPKSEPAPARTNPPRETPRGKHAKGKHAAPPSLARRVALGVLVLLLIATLGPALIGVGIFLGILWAWLGRGLTKS